MQVSRGHQLSVFGGRGNGGTGDGSDGDGPATDGPLQPSENVASFYKGILEDPDKTVQFGPEIRLTSSGSEGENGGGAAKKGQSPPGSPVPSPGSPVSNSANSPGGGILKRGGSGDNNLGDSPSGSKRRASVTFGPVAQSAAIPAVGDAGSGSNAVRATSSTAAIAKSGSSGAGSIFGAAGAATKNPLVRAGSGSASFGAFAGATTTTTSSSASEDSKNFLSIPPSKQAQGERLSGTERKSGQYAGGDVLKFCSFKKGELATISPSAKQFRILKSLVRKASQTSLDLQVIDMRREEVKIILKIQIALIVKTLTDHYAARRIRIANQDPIAKAEGT